MANSVRVTWTAGSPRCSGTEVHQRPSGPVIEAVRGMRCTITVRVANDGLVGVHLDSALAPFVGAGTGTVVTAADAEGTTGYGIDARYELARSLAPGEAYRFPVTLVFHPSGCNNGVRFWVRHWPKVRVTVLGLVHERAASETFCFRRSGRTPGCAG